MRRLAASREAAASESAVIGPNGGWLIQGCDPSGQVVRQTWVRSREAREEVAPDGSGQDKGCH